MVKRLERVDRVGRLLGAVEGDGVGGLKVETCRRREVEVVCDESLNELVKRLERVDRVGRLLGAVEGDGVGGLQVMTKDVAVERSTDGAAGCAPSSAFAVSQILKDVNLRRNLSRNLRKEGKRKEERNLNQMKSKSNIRRPCRTCNFGPSDR